MAQSVISNRIYYNLGKVREKRPNISRGNPKEYEYIGYQDGEFVNAPYNGVIPNIEKLEVFSHTPAFKKLNKYQSYSMVIRFYGRDLDRNIYFTQLYFPFVVLTQLYDEDDHVQMNYINMEDVDHNIFYEQVFVVKGAVDDKER